MASTPAALFDAIDAGDAERVRQVLSADQSLASARDEHGVSALLRARYRSDRTLVEAIRERLGSLDVFEAAALGDVERLRALLDAEPDAANARSGDGFTPLHLAAFFGGAAAVELLLDRGAALDERGTGWMTGTPLHSACAANDADAARRLLAAGADPNARQSGGFTPLHAAAEHGNAALARALLDAGADPTAATDDGATVVTLAEGSADADTIGIVRGASGRERDRRAP